MKKFLLFLSAIFFLSSIILAQNPESEPNNSSGEANTFALNSTITGQVGLSGDNEDWYKLTTTKYGCMTLIGDPESALDFYITFYAADGTTQLKQSSSTNGTGINDTLIFNNFNAGSYYIVIVQNNSTSGTYTLNNIFTETLTDIDDNVYPIVKIGTQIWMAKNLRVTKYADGTAIPTQLNNTEWKNTTEGAYGIHPHDVVVGIDSDEEMLEAYGALYNWYAVNESNAICPSGWHIPTDMDWFSLIQNIDPDAIHLGSPESETAGEKLKSTRTDPDAHPRWNTPNPYSTNETGFSAMPGDDRSESGYYYIFSTDIGESGNWWTSTSFNTASAISRYLTISNAWVVRSLSDKNYGYSARCIKDAEPETITAAFTSDLTTGMAPLIVNFTDQSTGSPTSWTWDFGDGNSTTEQNPTHTYTAAGNYTVALTVSDGTESKTETKTNYISVTQESTDNIWTYQTSSSTANLQSVFFIDDNHGWTVGWSNTILRTEDGGNHWNPTSSTINQSMWDIYFLDQNTGWAVGSDGAVLKSTDGGKNWTSQISGTTASLFTVWFIDANTGFIAGEYGRRYKTTNGGEDWIEQTKGSDNIKDIFFQNGIGYQVGYMKFYKSTDGGDTWNVVYTFPQDDYLYEVQFLDDNIGFIAGDNYMSDPDEGFVYKTTNGGSSWDKIMIDTKAIYNLHFVNKTVGYAAGGSIGTGKIWRTTNAGQSWDQMEYYPTAPSDNLNSVFFPTLNIGYAVGRSGNILKIETTTAQTLEAAFTVSVTSGTIPLTVNFTDQSTGNPTSWIWDFGDGNSSTEQNPTHTYTAASDYTVTLTVSDGTNNKTETKTNYISVTETSTYDPILEENFDETTFPPSGWTQRVTNTAKTWLQGNSNTSPFNDIDATNVYSALCPWVAEDQDEWLLSPVISLADGIFTLEFYAGFSTAYLGSATLILNISTNGGADWTNIWEASDDDEGWIWRKITVDLSNYANNANVMLAWQYVGNDGDLVGIDNVKVTHGTTSIFEQAFEKINTLFQNYPNPFTNQTRISFQLDNPKHIQLIIYNSLGQVIAEAFNKKLLAGDYNYIFDATGLKPGIYYYRLSIDGFSTTKPMILTK